LAIAEVELTEARDAVAREERSAHEAHDSLSVAHAELAAAHQAIRAAQDARAGAEADAIKAAEAARAVEEHAAARAAQMEAEAAEYRAMASRQLQEAVDAIADKDLKLAEADQWRELAEESQRLANEAKADRDAKAVEAARAIELEGVARARMAALVATVEERDASLERAQARRDGIISVHARLYAHEMRRLVRRETEKARRYAATPQKLKTWMRNHYSDESERAIFRDNLAYVVAVHLAEVHADGTAVERTEAIVRAHWAESKRVLQEVLASDPDQFAETLERVLQQWDAERAERFADMLVAEEVTHVRHR
jgi:hypothetical protein